MFLSMLHVIGITYNIELLTLQKINLGIEKNASRGRCKKVTRVFKRLPAFERNSTGPLNHELFPIPTNSTQSDTPISTLISTAQF
ncbi:hypothetical protein BpHYR1_027698 [Brachionus plicatilis]|uniref:Uncharacterized protein n=1 Tax=Brachionus plicatilis TaxID=10195 RepID=A0A3M7Q5J5_BRAPC|nr:hypothetical protein BpHYR1_027698 [Brachionus plicatilis]